MVPNRPVKVLKRVSCSENGRILKNGGNIAWCDSQTAIYMEYTDAPKQAEEATSTNWTESRIPNTQS